MFNILQLNSQGSEDGSKFKKYNQQPFHFRTLNHSRNN